MTQETIQNAIKAIMASMIAAGEAFLTTSEMEHIILFKQDMKSIRSFVDTVRLHRGEKGLHLGDPAKKMYKIAGGIIEHEDEIAEEKKKSAGSVKISKLEDNKKILIEEWKNCFSVSALQKLEKQLCDYDYGKVPEFVLQNFLKRASVADK
ncbi:MAG: hypothetical protein EBX41_00015 [Chitinophagia bacterium]|nr:hypothetical protein [Chitinophagia bacterium]